MKRLRFPDNMFLKVFVIFWGVMLGVYFLPFVIGGYLFYFFYKHIHNLVVRNSILIALAIPILLFGSIWTLGITRGVSEPSPSPTLVPAVILVPTTTLTPTSIPTPTTQLSATPTANASLIKPTTKPTFKPTASPAVQSAITSVPLPTYAVTIPDKTKISPTPIPYKDPPATVQTQTNTSSGFSCNCAKTCTAMSSCAEAQYQLNVCGCRARDADHDGVACDAQCQ